MTQRERLTDGLELHTVVRPARGEVSSVTVSLVNTHRPAKGESRDEASWFRPRLVVRSSEPFVDRPLPRAYGIDEDLESHALLFRDVPNLAVGARGAR
ncbi:hypothetical protein [Georgenia sp. SUBG003]|uniref:hypothetical protein n=1 Tax=Georgenia sp. SUBG003 TaxID=1497974 RepID=UPI003AB7E8CF